LVFNDNAGIDALVVVVLVVFEEDDDDEVITFSKMLNQVVKCSSVSA